MEFGSVCAVNKHLTGKARQRHDLLRADWPRTLQRNWVAYLRN